MRKYPDFVGHVCRGIAMLICVITHPVVFWRASKWHRNVTAYETAKEGERIDRLKNPEKYRGQ
jgi:hypothetical protein